MPSNGADDLNEPVAVRRVRFVVAYDGAAYHGFASNHGVPTAGGELADALSTVCRIPVALAAAGRTDAGVHGWGQVVSCDLPATVDLDDVSKRVNAICAGRIVVRAASWAADDFHARFSAAWREYRYTIVNAPTINPFLAATAWHVRQPLSLPAMQLACDPLIGEQNFTSFCRKPKPIPGEPEASMNRRVMIARWSEIDGARSVIATDQRVLRFEIRANAFCQQMVRAIVGLMVDIGQGERHAGEVRQAMLARDRRAVPNLAPPHGLMLWDVGYGADG